VKQTNSKTYIRHFLVYFTASNEVPRAWCANDSAK